MGKPTVKDGTVYRWYFHPTCGWEVVHVGPWDHRTCTFNRAGFSEDTRHWVKHTKAWQWGPIISAPKKQKVPKWVLADMPKCIALVGKVRGPR